MRTSIVDRVLPLVLTTTLWVWATPTMAQQAKMHGDVLDESGSPVVKAEVILEPVAEGDGVRVAVATSRRGSYLLGLIQPGSYRLRIVADGKVVKAVSAVAVDAGKSEAWKLDGPYRASQPPTLNIRDGMDIRLDAVLGSGIAVAGASGQALVSPDEELDRLVKQVQDGDCAGALPGLEALLVADPARAKAHYLAGYCQADQGADAKAVDSLARVLELQPTFPGAALLRGQVLRRMGRNDEALTMFERQAQSTEDGTMVGQVYLQIGLIHRDAGRDAQAIESFEKAVGANSKAPEAYGELWALYTKLGQKEKAEAVFARASQAGAVDAVLLLNAGIAQLNRKEFDQAEATFRRVITMGGTNADLGMAHGLLGRCLLRGGKNEEAAQALRKSLELDPDGGMAADTRKLLDSISKKK